MATTGMHCPSLAWGRGEEERGGGGVEAGRLEEEAKTEEEEEEEEWVRRLSKLIKP